MRIIVDMNLSPMWVDVLRSAGHSVAHWSEIGDHRASDRVIFDWAASNGYVVFTHDLDFGAILAALHSKSPSVLQIRSHAPHPDVHAGMVLSALRDFEEEIDRGAVVVVDHARRRVRLLPLG